MIIYTHCHGCGERTEIFGLSGDLGFQCAGCASHAHCHDCGTLMHKSLLTDLGDGYATCEDCQLEVVTRAAMAQQEAHR